MRNRSIALLAMLALFSAAYLSPGHGSNASTNEIVLTLGKNVVVDNPYARGEKVTVLVRNDTEKPYVWETLYQACDLRFIASGRTVKIPEGTHCDIVSPQVLKPGETVKLFTWDLDECVRDEWGCVESRTLAAGTYTIEGTFYPPTTLTSGEDEFLIADETARPAKARISFEIVTHERAHSGANRRGDL